jgi:hypothetical protein
VWRTGRRWRTGPRRGTGGLKQWKIFFYEE